MAYDVHDEKKMSSNIFDEFFGSVIQEKKKKMAKKCATSVSLHAFHGGNRTQGPTLLLLT